MKRPMTYPWLSIKTLTELQLWRRTFRIIMSVSNLTRKRISAKRTSISGTSDRKVMWNRLGLFFQQTQTLSTSVNSADTYSSDSSSEIYGLTL